MHNLFIRDFYNIPPHTRKMKISKPFALITVACALGLTAMVNPVAACEASYCNCNDRRLSDSFLYPDGKYEEHAQPLLDQRRKLAPCTCRSNNSVSTIAECCKTPTPTATPTATPTSDCSAPVRRRLGKKEKKEKETKSPKCSKKDEKKSDRRLGKRRVSADESEVRSVPIATNRKEELPWAAPAADAAELLAADPGIWVAPGFLDEEIVDKLTVLVDKYGTDLDHYRGCSPLHPEEKKCFRFTPSLAETNKDDSELYLQVRAKVESIWPRFRLRDYFMVMDQKGNAGPSDYHNDGVHTFHMPATVLIYLTDSEEGTGGDTVFPLVGENGLSVSPRKGTVLTWLNVHADGLLKEKSIHGVQATTPESSGRIVLTQKFFLSPEEFLEVTGQANSVI